MKQTHIIHLSPASRRDAQKREKRRQRAARLFAKGIPRAEVARLLGVTPPAVHYWYTAWKRKGKDGLAARRPGPKPRMTKQKVAKIKKALRVGAITAGYADDLWTLARIGSLIKRETSIDYGTTQVWYFLRSIGWSHQKPETQARNRNDHAIKQWKAVTWPAIQKKGEKRAHA